MSEQTLAIIKPDAMAAGFSDAIIDHILKSKFTIVKKEQKTLSQQEAGDFYGEHKERPFFEELVKFMTSGPVIIMVLEKENAIAEWRNTMGATDPAEAAEGTIRKMFGASKGKNATHGSDSSQSAQREIDFFFGNK